MKTAEKAVFLTFDDGPHPRVTPWVLDQLDRFGARATFFCVGENVTRYPEVYSDLLNRGHSGGNHTYNHLNGWKTDVRTYMENVSKCAEVVKSELFRPPYGRFTLLSLRALRKTYRVIMWDILSRDFARDLDIGYSLERIKSSVGNGSVIVFHDSEKAEKNLMRLLPEVLQFLHNEGYSMKKL